MKITFWSAVDPNSTMSEVIKNLKLIGYEVNVIYLIKESNYRLASGLSRKILNRLIIYFLFPLYFITRNLFCSNITLIVLTTNPFYLSFIANIIFRKRFKIIQLVWDLYPQALNASKYLFLKSCLSYASKKMVESSLKMSLINVFISESMMNKAKSNYANISSPVLIPVGCRSSLFKGCYPKPMLVNTKVNIIYCGNIGVVHDVNTLIKSFKSNRFEKLSIYLFTIAFYSFGSNYSILKQELVSFYPKIEGLIEFHGPLNDEEWTKKMKSSQISLVTLGVDGEFASMPSKTYSALAAGHAILAICPLNSELANLILKYDCGWVHDINDVNGFLNTLESIFSNPNEVFRKRCNAYKLGEHNFSSFTISKQWANVFDSA